MASKLLCRGLTGALLGAALFAGAAHAQATRTWVSGVGDDANPCSRTAPCKTFAGAISKTASGGEISVLDPGGFGAVTITKSISITQDSSGEAGILASGTNGINVNGANIVVQLRGLVIDGAGTGLVGVNILQGQSVHLEKCVIKNFGAGSAIGVKAAPSSGTFELYINDCAIAENASTGVSIEPTGTASVIAELKRVNVLSNGNGIRADTGATTGAIKLAVSDSVSAGNTANGVVAVSDNSASFRTQIALDRTVVANNASDGLRAQGAAATIRVGNSVVTGNNIPADAAGGQIGTFQNNNIQGNTNAPVGLTNLPLQ